MENRDTVRQLTLEQHKFELQLSTYKWIFFYKFYNTPQPEVG